MTYDNLRLSPSETEKTSRSSDWIGCPTNRMGLKARASNGPFLPSIDLLYQNGAGPVVDRESRAGERRGADR